MGRYKLDKTAVEIARQKRRWADARNKRRRENYRKDLSYRQNVNQHNRDSYRRRRPLPLRDLELRDCAENIGHLKDFGKVRDIRVNKKQVRKLTLTIAEMAKALGGYHQIVLYRWHREGKFPKPNHTVVASGDLWARVYTGDQAERLMKVMSKHQQQKMYLHGTDKETIRSLFKAMKEPRQHERETKTSNSNGETPN